MIVVSCIGNISSLYDTVFGDDKLKLWTIQEYVVWEKIKTNGFYRTTIDFISRDFYFAYLYMIKQMEKRLRIRRHHNEFPIWAWYQFDGEKKKPDLRRHGHLPKGTRGILIEFEIDDRYVLLSDFELWHYPLNYWYLPESEEDDNNFETELVKRGLNFYREKPLSDLFYHKKIERSWEKIFDLDWKDEKGEIARSRHYKSIQGTLWELKFNQVLKIKEFIAR